MPGIYIHVPFCKGKCPYCDFYSLKSSEEDMDRYTNTLADSLWQKKGITASTIYFGGGTPSALGRERLVKILSEAKRAFLVSSDCEITVEVNPGDGEEAFFKALKQAGFNRISMGLQSADEDELKLLGRRHTAEEVKKAVTLAREAGFDNISVDLMLALPVISPGKSPKGSMERLKKSIDFAVSLNVSHISAYILKVEEGTPFASRYKENMLPDDEETAQQYLFMAEALEKMGYNQYEISNFSKPGMESRHNLIYWHGEEYIGFGPSAHSFYNGKRFHFTRDLEAFINGEEPVQDGDGGDFEEFAMLALRLREGLKRRSCISRFENGEALFEGIMNNIKKCPPDLVSADSEHISLTPKGFVVSNAVILTLLGY